MSSFNQLEEDVGELSELCAFDGNDNMEDTDRLRTQVEEVIEQIPLAEKTAYLHALERCPHLVERETNPLYFLRLVKNNVWQAAQKIVGYWHHRLEMFGDRRAFLSMDDLSGNGALDEEAITALRAGTHILLPNDKNGHPVLFFDATLIHPSVSYLTTQVRRQTSMCPHLVGW